ncbi:Putative type II secretion system protein E [Bacillus sp. THAF10]|uniref:competence type IV pilus ATPase ComGA n=1 Tax=Bacillus sp. THAF10 TaxID=2587848 RepID=UPI00126863BD|nr:competence type IV pilus ATPase ComGA [Bacillus sp. THAF10]QFT89797.1 Putative type II secretion system protein E [Bacillus sp. THAF10]
MNIEKKCEELIRQAVRLRVSDIHMKPLETTAHVLFRLDHYLYDQEKVPIEVYERMLSHLKFQAAMDIGETRKPQNGALALQVDSNQINLRLSTLPTLNRESLVIRILPQEDHQFSLKHLSLFQHSTRKIMSLMKHSHGLFIFTGPTGSGKTTTLYSILEESKSMLQRNIITLEDPVERKSRHVLQVQVNEKAGISYSSGLKAILRHDPDIIIVGEIRDEETAKIAIRAALTGHLVLSTLHTRDAKGAIFRLLEFGVSHQDLEQSLIAVSAQRLVELTCPYCKEECSAFCKKYRTHRLASVYELLYGNELQKVLQQCRGNSVLAAYPTLKEVIKKGIALGFIHQREYERWVNDGKK